MVERLKFSLPFVLECFVYVLVDARGKPTMINRSEIQSERSSSIRSPDEKNVDEWKCYKNEKNSRSVSRVASIEILFIPYKVLPSILRTQRVHFNITLESHEQFCIFQNFASFKIHEYQLLTCISYS